MTATPLGSKPKEDPDRPEWVKKIENEPYYRWSVRRGIQMFNYVNAFRKKNGLSPTVWNKKLHDICYLNAKKFALEPKNNGQHSDSGEKGEGIGKSKTLLADLKDKMKSNNVAQTSGFSYNIFLRGFLSPKKYFNRLLKTHAK